MHANIIHMRAKIRLVAVALSLIAGLVIVPPATAVQGGQEATGDGVVVALIHGRTAIRSFCSGALLQPRIVVTAAHCVIENGNIINYPNSLFVSTPGADLNRDSIAARARVTEINWVRGYQNRSNTIEPNDFAVLTLDKALATPVLTRVATAAEIRSIQNNRGAITHLGYGKLALDRDGDGIPRKIELRARPSAGSFQFPAGSYIQTTGTSTQSICPGDSGGPIVTQIGNELVLVGVNAGGDTSCIPSFNGTHIATGMVASFYQNVINQGVASIANSAPAEPREVKYEIAGSDLNISWQAPAADSTAPTGYRVEEVLESKRAYLGVYVQDAASGGVAITNVITDTPAAYANIEALDVVLAVGGVSVANTDAMLTEMRKKTVGELVTFRIRKSNGEIKNITVRLSEIGDATGYNKVCETTTTTLSCQAKTKPGKTKYRLYALSAKGDGTAYEFNVELGPGGPPSNIKLKPVAGAIEVTWGDQLRISSVPKAQIKVKVIDAITERVLCDVALTDYKCTITATAGEYQLAILAETALGRSERIELAAIELTAAGTAASTPNKVRNAKITKNAKTSNYTIAWQAPASNGGAAVTGYQVSNSGGKSICRVTASATTCTIKTSSLKAGSKIFIVAINAKGKGLAKSLTVPR